MANPTILQAGYDPTSATVISGALLKQLVSSAQFASGIGGIVVTTDVAGVPQLPDATDYPAYQQFGWIRISPTTLTAAMYLWNPNAQYILSYTGGSVSTNWTPAFSGAIPAGSILGSQIAPATIEPSNIDLPSLLTALGLTPSSYITTATTPNSAGAISGSFGSGLTIKNFAVTNLSIAQDGTNGIVNNNINNKVIMPAKLGGGNQGQILATTSGTNDVSWVNPNTVGARILQQIVYYDTQTSLSDTTHIAVTGNPTFAAGTLYGTAGNLGSTSPNGQSGLIAAITPMSSTSKIRVEVSFHGSTSSTDWMSIALFSDITGAKFSGFSSSTGAIAATCTYSVGGIVSCNLVYEITSGGTTELDYAIRFGSIGNTTYANRDSTKTSFFGGAGSTFSSCIKLTEYI